MFDGFFSLPAELISAIGTVLGFAFVDGLDFDEQNVLGNFLMLIGQILCTVSAQEELFADLQTANQMSAMQKSISELKREIEILKGGTP